MKLLAFETATEACSVALWVDGEVRERFELAPRRHAELSLPWAEQLLADAGVRKSQLDAIAVGRGPGAFTGVRLAIAIAQGIALALDRPIVPVSTLAALAASLPLPLVGEARGEGTPAPRVLAAIDATALPHATDVARLAAVAFERGEAVAPERVEPAYLRNNVALTIREQQALRDSR